MNQRQNAAELKLRKLAVDLKKAYGRATQHIAAELKPIEVAVEEIGETWKPLHYAEMAKEKGTDEVERSATCFAVESSISGTEVEYLLCVGRNSEMKCGLYVSVCKSQIKVPDGDEGETRREVTIKNKALVPLSALPVPIRMKVLDILEEFAAAYDEHVRDSRKPILHEWSSDGAGGSDEAEAAGEEASSDKKEDRKEGDTGRVRLFSPEDMNTPLEQWIPSLSGKR